MIFRMSEEDHGRLLDQAAREGRTAQEMFEVRMLGYSQPVGTRQRRHPQRRSQSEELPLTG